MSTATKKIPQKPAGRELFFLNTTIIFWGRNDKDKDIKRKRARIDRMLVGWRRFSSWIFMFCCLYREKALCWLWSLASILRLLTCSVKKLCFFFFTRSYLGALFDCHFSFGLFGRRLCVGRMATSIHVRSIHFLFQSVNRCGASCFAGGLWRFRRQSKRHQTRLFDDSVWLCVGLCVCVCVLVCVCVCVCVLAFVWLEAIRPKSSGVLIVFPVESDLSGRTNIWTSASLKLRLRPTLPRLAGKRGKTAKVEWKKNQTKQRKMKRSGQIKKNKFRKVNPKKSKKNQWQPTKSYKKPVKPSKTQ